MEVLKLNATDFNYDNLFLSDFGCIICDFNGGGTETISMGSNVSFSTTPVENGKRFLVTSAKYDECIEAEFAICKNPDIYDNDEMFFTIDEQRAIMRWLNRSEFCRFQLVGEEYDDIYFQGSFNIDKIVLNAKVIGMNLRFQSNRPFAFGADIIDEFTIANSGDSHLIVDESDEIGYTYPTIEITLNASGNLSITNSFDDSRVTTINNCISGEKITIENMIIETSIEAHEATIMNDFNFVFPQICNSYNNSDNLFSFSLPCTCTFSYIPIKKVGL